MIRTKKGIEFATQPFRTTIKKCAPYKLPEQLDVFTMEYGEYFYLQKRGDNTIFVAVTSEPAYCLGESVLAFFKKYPNLIYCEKLSGKDDFFLVVVIVNGQVYLDNKIHQDTLLDELSVFFSEKTTPFVFMFTKELQSLQKKIQKNAIEAFKIVEGNILEKLPLNENLLFSPLDLAMHKAGFSYQMKSLIIGLLLAFIIVAPIAYFGLRPEPTITQKVVNPYAQYKQALMSPSPLAEVRSMMTQLNVLFQTPHWLPKAVSWSDGQTKISVSATSIELDELKTWALKNNAHLILRDKQVNLLFNTESLPHRSKPKKIFPMQTVVFHFIDKLHRFSNTLDIKESRTTQQGAYQETILTVQFNGYSTSMLESLFRETHGSPVVLQKFQAQIDHGLMTGSIEFLLLGK